MIFGKKNAFKTRHEDKALLLLKPVTIRHDEDNDVDEDNGCLTVDWWQFVCEAIFM